MKITSRLKKPVSVLLALIMTVAMFTTAIGTFNAATASISYSYSGSGSAKAGYAQGTVTLSAPAGTYWLYWANDTKALDGYYKLAKLTVGSSGSATHTMYAQTAIPADATKLIAISSTSEPATKTVASAAAVYDIPQSKRLAHKTSERKYRFASYSDVHIDAMYRTYKNADTHWAKALETAYQRDVDFIVASGDYINNNVDYASISQTEWQTYQKILADSNYCNPVYEAIGNHELWHSPTDGTAEFIKATGLEGSNGTASKAYFEKTLNGDHFIFMSMEGGFYPNQVEEFSDAQLNWLEGLLKKYSGDGHNLYIIEHSLFYKYGAGDRTNAEPYYDIPLSDKQDSTVRFKKLLETYKDSIFISGHTHIAFDEQLNYSDNSGTSAQMIHNSSVGGVRHIVNGELSRDYPEGDTEGYIVDVFDDAIIFNGANLYYNMYDPNCCYIVKTSAQVLGIDPSDTTDPTDPPESGTTARPTSSVKPTAAPTTAQPTTAAPKATSYYLRGSFNSWGTSNPLYETSDSDIITTTLKLSAGTYTFKINNGSTWYGNNGTIEDTTKKTSNGGWIMGTGDGDCTLKATGGYYTFNFTLSSKKLNLLYSATDPNPTVAPTTAGSTTKTYYLFGYINGADYGCEADYANMGSYKFVNGKLNATFESDSYVAVKQEGNAAWYMTDGFLGMDATSGKLIETSKLGNDADKLHVPAGEVNFTLSENSDGSLTLSYTVVSEPTEAPTTAAPTTAAPTAAPTTAAPTTAVPTAAPTTAAPSTAKPTAAPTTAAPSTAKPTAAPTTAAPSTAKPTAAPSGKTYYLFGYINGADYACEDDYANMGTYKFVNGKLTATFAQDSYVAVKEDKNAAWYMTDGYLGSSATSGTLYNTTTLGENADKLHVPAGTAEFTLAENTDGTLTLSYTMTSTAPTTVAPTTAPSGKTYYLFGYIDGADYACEDDYANMGTYKFVNGKLTATFAQDSYVAVKEDKNAAWYMTDGYLGATATSGKLYNTDLLGEDADKLHVPAGEAEFTLTENSDGTLTLSYTMKSQPTQAPTTAAPTTARPTAAPTTAAPTTVAPTTARPTAAPTTAAPTTVAPTTARPTAAPTTAAPTTVAPTTARPTAAPTTAAPTTVAPTTARPTAAPTTAAPTTVAPTTARPTAAPTTAAPTTVAPTTAAPTQAPTTVAPTQAPTTTPGPKTYYLFGYINGQNYGCEEDSANMGGYKFRSGKVTALLTSDSYVAVKESGNAAWYMTDGNLGTNVTSATLKNTNQLGENADKLYVPAGKVEFILTENSDGTLNLSYRSLETPTTVAPTTVPTAKTYYLFGIINGKEYGYGEDAANIGGYKFRSGKVSAAFTEASYVAVKLSGNAAWYMTDGDPGTGVTSAVLKDKTTLGDNAGLLYVPAGTMNFTLTENSDGTVTLSYAPKQAPTVAPTTAPATAKPTQAPTQAPTTAAPTQAPTQPEEDDFIIGDVNSDGEVTIKDATQIQKYLAGLSDARLTPTQIKAADVNGDGDVTINDATDIQKYIANIIKQFAAEQNTKKSVEPVGAGEAALLSTVSGNLSRYYRYSSYDCYQALKKEYRADLALSNAGNASSIDTSKLTSLQNALLAVVDTSNVDSTTTSMNVYFENTNSWSEVYAYVWGNNGTGEEKAWPGTKISSIGKNEYGKSIYKYTVTNSKYKNVIFNNGSSLQTDDLRLYINNVCYYLSSDSSPYYSKGYIFKDKYIVSTS